MYGPIAYIHTTHIHTTPQNQSAALLWMLLGRLKEERKHVTLVHNTASTAGKEAGADQQALDSANLDEVCVCVYVCMCVHI